MQKIKIRKDWKLIAKNIGELDHLGVHGISIPQFKKLIELGESSTPHRITLSDCSPNSIMINNFYVPKALLCGVKEKLVFKSNWKELYDKDTYFLRLEVVERAVIELNNGCYNPDDLRNERKSGYEIMDTAHDFANRWSYPNDWFETLEVETELKLPEVFS